METNKQAIARLSAQNAALMLALSAIIRSLPKPMAHDAAIQLSLLSEQWSAGDPSSPPPQREAEAHAETAEILIREMEKRAQP